jgi:plasmid maintenance system antidote protein VapI
MPLLTVPGHEDLQPQERLMIALRRRGWTQTDLAQAAHTYQSNISSSVAGTRPTSVEWKARLEAALGYKIWTESFAGQELNHA